MHHMRFFTIQTWNACRSSNDSHSP